MSTTTGPQIPYAMPAQLFLGDGAGSSSTFRTGRASAGKSLGWDADWPSATWTTTDASTSYRLRERPAGLAPQSESASQDHFLMLVLEGTTSNRDAVGARWP